MSFCWKTVLFIVGFSLFFEFPCYSADPSDKNIPGGVSKHVASIEKISRDEHVLKEICTSILSRNPDIVRLKEKLNRDHSEEKYVLWRKYATGEETDMGSLSKNDKVIVKKKKRSYLKKEVINNIQTIGLEAVKNGKAKLVENTSHGGYAIEITHNYNDAGIYGEKITEKNKIMETLNPTKIVFGFSVDDIIKKILDEKNWNKNLDGYPATVFTE